jgi:hypothetical protein
MTIEATVTQIANKLTNAITNTVSVDWFISPTLSQQHIQCPRPMPEQVLAGTSPVTGQLGLPEKRDKFASTEGGESWRQEYSDTRRSCGHCFRVQCRRILSGIYASGPSRREARAQMARKDHFRCCGSRVHSLGYLGSTAPLTKSQYLLFRLATYQALGRNPVIRCDSISREIQMSD